MVLWGRVRLPEIGGIAARWEGPVGTFSANPFATPCGTTEMNMRTRQPLIALFCAGAIALSAQDLARPRAGISQTSDSPPVGRDVPVLTVCEVLTNASVYKGRSLIVVGKY